MKIKCIDELTIELPIDKGLYAITGQNGSGKSTISACASSVFFNVPITSPHPWRLSLPLRADRIPYNLLLRYPGLHRL